MEYHHQRLKNMVSIEIIREGIAIANARAAIGSVGRAPRAKGCERAGKEREVRARPSDSRLRADSIGYAKPNRGGRERPQRGAIKGSAADGAQRRQGSATDERSGVRKQRA